MDPANQPDPPGAAGSAGSPDARFGADTPGAGWVGERSSERRRLAYSSLRDCPVVAWNDSAGAHSLPLEGRIVIGSDPRADIVLADAEVTRLHAELEPRSDGVWLRDLGSRGGSLVGGVRVMAALVPQGAEIRVGSTVLRVTYATSPAAVDVWRGDCFGELIGHSRVMRELFARLARIAKMGEPVLVTGETGSGKELVARAIHDHHRRGQPFVVVDCAALPDAPSAWASLPASLEAARGGTLFLDEVGDLPLSTQPKLLRALDAPSAGQSAVRFISATHRDLRELVNVGAFREDLYFRLCAVPVSVPPLRERPEDIPPLVEHFLEEPPSADLLVELVERPWLGNVRELRNFVHRVRALGTREALALTSATNPTSHQVFPSAPPPSQSFPSSPPPRGRTASIIPTYDAAARQIGSIPPAPLPPRIPGSDPRIPIDKPLKDVREEVEREYLRRLLERHDRNTTLVAQAAGIDRTYVYRLIRKYDL